MAVTKQLYRQRNIYCTTFLSISVWNVMKIRQLLTRTGGRTDGRAVVIQGVVFRGFGIVV
jgi:hypothetical protein